MSAVVAHWSNTILGEVFIFHWKKEEEATLVLILKQLYSILVLLGPSSKSGRFQALELLTHIDPSLFKKFTRCSSPAGLKQLGGTVVALFR